MNRTSSALISTSATPVSMILTTEFGSLEIAGRVLLALLFLVSGLQKIGGYPGMVAYMSSFGLSGSLLPMVIATEVLGAIAIMVGWKTRITAVLLAGYTVLTAIIFHRNFGDQTQAAMFLKNLSIAGGFLLLAANGAGPVSLDRRFSKSLR
jgi:putative oxidoreductase